MDFYDVVKEVEKQGVTYNPFAARISGKWVEGYTSIDYLNRNFSEYETAKEMKEATNSEGIKKYLDWLAEKGKIPE